VPPLHATRVPRALAFLGADHSLANLRQLAVRAFDPAVGLKLGEQSLYLGLLPRFFLTRCLQSIKQVALAGAFGVQRCLKLSLVCRQGLQPLLELAQCGGAGGVPAPVPFSARRLADTPPIEPGPNSVGYSTATVHTATGQRGDGRLKAVAISPSM